MSYVHQSSLVTVSCGMSIFLAAALQHVELRSFILSDRFSEL